MLTIDAPISVPRTGPSSAARSAHWYEPSGDITTHAVTFCHAGFVHRALVRIGQVLACIWLRGCTSRWLFTALQRTVIS